MPVVESVMTASASEDRVLSRLVEKAMSAAASKAQAMGEKDPAKIRAAMLRARDDVKAAVMKASDNG